MDEASAAFAERIFPATGINSGSSALPKDQLFKRMSRSEFVTYIRETTVSRRNSPTALVTHSAQPGRQPAPHALSICCVFVRCSSVLSTKA
jgi:hypothetical protein